MVVLFDVGGILLAWVLWFVVYWCSVGLGGYGWLFELLLLICGYFGLMICYCYCCYVTFGVVGLITACLFCCLLSCVSC